MKFFSALVISLALICLSFRSPAQSREANFFPDSIRVEFPKEKAVVIFEMRRFQKNTSFIQSFSGRFQELLNYIKKAAPSDFREGDPLQISINLKPEDEDLIIRVGGAGDINKLNGEKAEITMQKSVPRTNLIVRKNMIEQLLPPGWEVSIRTKDIMVTLYAATFEGLEEVSKQDFKQVESVLNSDAGMKNIGKKSIQARLIVNDNHISQHVIEYNYSGDMIAFNAEAGVGLYRERIYPELTFSSGIYLSDRFGRSHQRIEVSYSTLFFTEKQGEGGYNTNVNSFLSLSYGLNFSKSDRSKWTSVGAGLLVHKRGDYFEGKTMKFFFSSDIGSPKLNIVPEFYLTDDFRKFQFGLKLNYRF